jgi:hypothetical protein
VTATAAEGAAVRRTTIATIAATVLLAAACTTDAIDTSDAASSSVSPAPAPAPAPAPPAPPAPEQPARPERNGDPLPLTPETLALLTWTTDCTEDGSVREVQLERGDPDGGAFPSMRPGGEQLHYRDDPSSPFRMLLTVDLSVVARVDLGLPGEGAGTQALAVDTSCFLGNGFSHAVEVWGVDEDGWPVQLPPALVYSKSDGYVIDLGDDGDTLIITMRVGAPGDDWPHLNGYPFIRVSEHSFDGARWTMTVRSIVEERAT